MVSCLNQNSMKLPGNFVRSRKVAVTCFVALWCPVFLAVVSAAPYLVLPINANWRYSTNNHDGINWQAVNFNEAGWSNASPALLYVEPADLPVPKNTPLPERIGADGGQLFPHHV